MAYDVENGAGRNFVIGKRSYFDDFAACHTPLWRSADLVAVER